MISVVISSRNDPIGCLFTARSLLNEAKSIEEELEVIIVDNSDDESSWRLLNWLVDDMYIDRDNILLLQYTPGCIFTARDYGVATAIGEIIIILDSHMMLGKNALISLTKLFGQEKDIGIVYGPLVYHNKNEESAFHSRNLHTFAPIQFGKLGQSLTKIPFRGAPFAIRKDYYEEINGYGVLSKHKFSWGGGDAYIGLKSLLFGNTNYLLKEFTGIHIGPFRNDNYLYKSSEFEKVNGPRWVGVLVAGYALGGTELLDKRIARIRRRLDKFENFSDRDYTHVMELGEEDRRWIERNAKYTYKEVVKRWPE